MTLLRGYLFLNNSDILENKMKIKVVQFCCIFTLFISTICLRTDCLIAILIYQSN